jgi:hypothetical protein
MRKLRRLRLRILAALRLLWLRMRAARLWSPMRAVRLWLPMRAARLWLPMRAATPLWRRVAR